MRKNQNGKNTVFDNIDPKVLEKVKSLRLIDDELMTVVFSGDNQVTELLLKILLNRDDLKVTKSMTQMEKHNLFGKSVRLDIIAEDLYKQEYNIEIQRAKKGAGTRRIRYHQAMIDSHTLQPQEDPESLPNLYIIFILEHDYFNKGEAVYRVIKHYDVQDSDGKYLKYDDGCTIMYINGDYRGDNPLGKLMHDFSTPNADEMYYNELAKKVRYHKQDSKGVHMASKIVEEYGDERAAEALQQGIQQGIQQNAIENARKMIADHLSPEKTSQYTGLPLEKVMELQKDLLVKVK